MSIACSPGSGSRSKGEVEHRFGRRLGAFGAGALRYREAADVFREELVLRFDRPLVLRLLEPLWRAPFPPDADAADVCCTRAIRSSGSSDASVFASRATPWACREKKSLFTSAYNAAPAAGKTTQRVLPPLPRRLPSAASAISETRPA
jgi:hypothetical protein